MIPVLADMVAVIDTECDIYVTSRLQGMQKHSHNRRITGIFNVILQKVDRM